MAGRILSKPQVEINGTIFSVVPNSLKVVYGMGVKDIKTQSQGGESHTTVTSHNIEEAVGQISFEVFVEEINVNALLDLYELNNSSNLEASFSNPSEGISGTMKNASFINDSEYNFTSDGKVEVQLKGDPIKRG